jgi:hypothetical protein
MIEPSAESFRMTTNWLISEGSMATRACGSSMFRSDWLRVIPMAMPASRCPLGSP